MGHNNIIDLQEIIGWDYSDSELLVEALTHSSSGNARKNRDNERMEFLGDRVLGLIVADLLYKQYPNDNEGGLAKRHATLVSGDTISKIAINIDLGRFLYMSESEKSSGGSANKQLLANAFEAILGSLYIDGGIAPCQDLIKKLWIGKIKEMVTPPQDPKTELQEWAQARNLGIPAYSIVGRDGPDHEPLFTVRLEIKGHQYIDSKDLSKRKAEKKAASEFLKRLKENDE